MDKESEALGKWDREYALDRSEDGEEKRGKDRDRYRESERQTYIRIDRDRRGEKRKMC